MAMLICTSEAIVMTFLIRIVESGPDRNTINNQFKWYYFSVLQPIYSLKQSQYN